MALVGTVNSKGLWLANTANSGVVVGIVPAVRSRRTLARMSVLTCVSDSCTGLPYFTLCKPGMPVGEIE